MHPWKQEKRIVWKETSQFDRGQNNFTASCFPSNILRTMTNETAMTNWGKTAQISDFLFWANERKGKNFL